MEAGNRQSAFQMLIRTLLFLKLPAFLPFWISLLFFFSGAFFFEAEAPLAAAMVFAGQILWFFTREKIYVYIQTEDSIAPVHAAPLSLLVWLMDVLSLVMVFPAISALSDYGEILAAEITLAVSAALAACLTLIWHKWKRRPLDGFSPVRAILILVWVTPLLMTINFGLDLRSPIKTSQIKFLDCPRGDRRMAEIWNDERFAGCKAFRSQAGTHHDQVAETSYYKGALGLSWRRTHLLPH